MSLIRSEEAFHWLQDGGVLEYPRCEVLYSVESLHELTEGYGSPTCVHCRCQGFIPRGGRRATVMDRFPASFEGGFTPIPNEFFEHAGGLGLRPLTRLVVIAMTSHRWDEGDRVFPSVERLAHMTGMGSATVKRHLRHLADAELIVRYPRRGYAGRWTSTEYDLEPLWQALADAATAAKRPHGGPK